MKQIITILILLISNVYQINAQKIISEGTIVFDIFTKLNNSEPKLGDLIDGATSTVVVKGNLLKTNVTSVLGKQETIIDTKNDKIYFIKNYSAQKVIITATSKNWKELNPDFENLIFVDAPETIVVQNYQCKKAVAKLPKGKTLTVYYSPDLILNNYQGFGFSKSIKGLPLQYEFKNEKSTIIYKVSNINFNAVKASEFDIPKVGYEVMTYEKSKELNDNPE